MWFFAIFASVKKIAKIIGWNGEKDEKSRKFLSDLKKLTTEYNDMSFNSIKNTVEKFKNSDSELLFIHIREPEEIMRASYEFNAYTLLIKRRGHNKITTNYSDASVENYDYDYIIENTTLENLDKEAKDFVDSLRKKNKVLYYK